MNLQLKIDATGDMRNSRKRDGKSEILGLLDLKEKQKKRENLNYSIASRILIL